MLSEAKSFFGSGVVDYRKVLDRSYVYRFLREYIEDAIVADAERPYSFEGITQWFTERNRIFREALSYGLFDLD